MPSCRVTRPKGELISQKSGHRSIFITQLHRQPLLFDAGISIDKQKQPPYTSATKAISLSMTDKILPHNTPTMKKEIFIN
jgi:hypothetical protein